MFRGSYNSKNTEMKIAHRQMLVTFLHISVQPFSVSMCRFAYMYIYFTTLKYTLYTFFGPACFVKLFYC